MDSRIRECSWSRWLRESNCNGTALYISGEIDKERYVGGSEVLGKHILLENRIATPTIGCFAAWQGNREWEGPFLVITEDVRIAHLGIITSLDPLLITHRNSWKGKFIVNQPLNEVRVQTTLAAFELAFYLPTGLVDSQVQDLRRK